MSKNKIQEAIEKIKGILPSLDNCYEGKVLDEALALLAEAEKQAEQKPNINTQWFKFDKAKGDFVCRISVEQFDKLCAIKEQKPICKTQLDSISTIEAFSGEEIPCPVCRKPEEEFIKLVKHRADGIYYSEYRKKGK